MINLFIDTSNLRLVVSIIDENNSLLYYYNEELKGELSKKALVVINEAITKTGYKPDDINRIFVVNGPGSFTGVRIGVTIAKTFAWALKKEIVTVSSLEVLASTNFTTDYIIPMIDARRESVYAGIYDKELNLIMNDEYISLEDLFKKMDGNKTYTFVSDTDINNVDIKKPDIDLIKIINKHKKDLSLNPHAVNPKYLKITEAEANLIKNNDNRNS